MYPFSTHDSHLFIAHVKDAKNNVENTGDAGNFGWAWDS